YVVDATTNATTNLVDVQTLGINVGSLNPGNPFYGQTNAIRNLGANVNSPSHDSLALSLIGKVGIGDLDISEDNNYLYFVNLYNKKLYKLDITGATPVLADSYDIPADCAGTGDARPFGLKVKDGKVYIGSVCDAYNSQNTSDMRAYVYALDESLGTFSPVFDFPLTYPKGYPVSWLPNITAWNPWSDDFNDIQVSLSGYELIYGQPILSDIEVDLDGSLILGFSDRSALQTGWKNYSPFNGDTKTYSNFAAGDILRAAYKNGTYVLENNAYVAGLTGSSPNNNQGPGFGEFYNDDFYIGSDLWHSEIAMGALALKPGSGQSIFTTVDPLYHIYDSGGFRYISNLTGLSPADDDKGALLYINSGSTASTFGKSVGLGDLELACSLVSFLEIGNYVWIDADADGIQDPTESGIPNVQVRLYDQSGLLVGLTTTDTNGEYYFNPTNVDNNGVNTTTGAATVGYTGLAPNTQYFIVLGQSGTNTFNATNDVLNYNGNEYALTNVNTGEGSVPDQNDSDASLASGVNAAFDGYPYIVANTGDVGSVDHTYDFGFTYGTIGNYVWTDTNSNGLQDEPTANGINGVTVELYQETSPGVFTLVQTTTTANDANGNPGYYLFIIGQSANYQVKFPTTNSTNILTQQTTTAATDGNSDANATTGESPIFAMNILGTGVAKDNLTIDAGYRSCNLSISSISGTDVSCNGGSDGTANVTASGNLSPVTYLWSNGE
ncbi:MAG TPA: SdrD B-like domain-containing protein, partial [Chitinophagales bacterium]|nr:SdrD B-like domain-containing protein [Chitinophagales bacterium]